MNFGPLLFLGIFLTFALAWVGLVFVPSATLNRVTPTQTEGSTLANPAAYTGDQQRGRAVYQREGCVYCHTQQVRGGQYNNDLLRGWGSRRSIPQDYVHDYPVLLGTMRTGPDLANIAARQNVETWHYQHLYDPQLITVGSIMAPFRFLFSLQKIGEHPSPDAVKFNFVFLRIAGDTAKVLADLKSAGFNLVEQRGERYLGGFDPAKLAELAKIPGVKSAEPYLPAGSEVVPSADARHLVAYLKCLDHSYEVAPEQNYGRLK